MKSCSYLYKMSLKL